MTRQQCFARVLALVAFSTGVLTGWSWREGVIEEEANTEEGEPTK